MRKTLGSEKQHEKYGQFAEQLLNVARQFTLDAIETILSEHIPA